MLHEADFVSEFWIFDGVSCKKVIPSTTSFGSSCAEPGTEMLANLVRNQKLRVLRPSIAAFRQTNLILAKRLSVSLGSVLLMGCAVTDVAIEDNESRPAGSSLKNLESGFDFID